MQYSCLLALILAAVVLARPHPDGGTLPTNKSAWWQRKRQWTTTRRPNGIFGSDSLAGDDLKSSDYSKPRGTEGHGEPTDGVHLHSNPDYSSSRYPSRQLGDRVAGVTDHDNYKRDGGNSFMGLGDSLMSMGDSVAQKGKSVLGGFPGLADDERTESYPRSRDGFSIDHANYKRDGGNSFMGLGDNLMSMGDTVVQKGLGGFQGLADDERTESYPRSRDGFSIDHANYKRDGGNSFMGLGDNLMSMGDTVVQKGLGGFQGLADDEKPESYPRSRDTFPVDHDNYKRDGGNSFMGLGDNLMSMGDTVAQKGKSVLGGLPGLANDEKPESYPNSRDSFPVDHDNYKRDGGNSIMGLGDNLMNLGQSLAQNARDALGSGRLADGQKDNYRGPTYQKRDFPFGVMGESKMGLDGIKGLSGLGGNLMGSGDSRRPNRLGAEMGGPHAAQGGDPEDDRMTGSGRRGGRLGNGVSSIVRHVSEKTELDMETINEMVAWPLFEKYGHAFDAFKLSITEPDTVFGDLNIPENVMTHLTSNIARRLTPQPVKVRADIEATCFAYSGIDAIRTALKLGESIGTESVPIKIRLVAPPLYVMVSNATDKQGAIELLETAIERIGESLKKDGGQLVVKMKPKAVSETDDLELAALMERVARENKEVSGDEDSDAD
ncbi:hypothetical protein PGTUg99_008943 [Puccinia graminis f. sp. tritici]|uniref:Uncharacterized protein n=1 Tax=Puccinia graminis f. sp. tritici TaxID=56615 RepID=A0A5B0SMS3_PUCGR|nr:hypothetical protein PGTUg99_008943 [Puccinia graminis f. sp. tritici]